MRRGRCEDVPDAGAVFITESGVLIATPEDSGFEQSEFFS